MSLKKLVLALLIANLGYFSYSQGWLQLLTDGDSSQREPERIAKQINADAIQVKPVPTLAIIPVAPEAVSLPAETCTVQREQWMIYMGPYRTTAFNERKKAELKQLGIASSEVSKPNLKIGLSLGQFESEALARQALARFASQGVKTATVVLWGIIDCP